MRQVTLTLPDDLANLIEEKVASGAYPSESDVVREGLEFLRDHEDELEDWLRREAVPALEAMKADPTRRRSIDQVRAALDAAHRRATASETR